MGLRDTLAEVKDRGSVGCSWAAWLDTLDSEDHDAALEALADGSWTHARLGEELEGYGAPRGAAKTIGRHRRGECVQCR
jgi:hypothetical protein